MTTRKWRNEIRVNTTAPGNQDQSNVAALADGGFVVAWRDDGPTDSIVRWQRFDAQGVKADAERNDSSAFIGDQSAPAIVQLNDGNLWITQTDLDGVTNFDIEGGVYSAATGGFVVSRLPVASANNEQAQRVASLGAAGSVAAWADLSSSTGDIFMHGFSSVGGNVFGTSAAGVIVNTNAGSLASAQIAPNVAASKDGQRFAVVWQDDGLSIGDIRARVFDVAGGQITAEFGVNVFTSSSQQAPAAAWIAPTKFVVAWHSFDPASGDGSSTAIKYVIRNMDGTVQGAERLANSSTHDTQLNPAICALNDGGFAIAWVDASLGGPDSDQAIRLQVFDGAGEKRGAEIVVNTTTNSSQLDPSLTTLADGRIVVSWTDFSTFAAGDGTTVRAQIVDPRDGIVDGTPFADTLYGHDLVADTMSGGDGDDTMLGLGGNDQIHGAFNNDTLNGGKGDDFLYGGNGNDTLLADLGDDEQYGEDGNDNLRGSAGSDLLDGGGGNDTANYGSSAVAISAALDGGFASTGDALGDSFVSVEFLQGANAAAGDNLRGDGANNALFGLNGNDTLRGMNGNDQCIGGVGADSLGGDLGDDRYNYNAVNEGGDTMADFANASNNNDAFQFRATAFGGGAPGAVDPTRFVTRAADNLAQDANDNFIFQTNTRQLWYDSTGNATAGDAVLIATLQVGGAMTAADVLMF